MKLEQQVTSLETSQKLKKLWVKQDSLFYWAKEILGTKKPCSDPWCCVYHYPYILGDGFELTEELNSNDDMFRESFSAFTSSELWQILPVGWHIKKYADMYRISAGIIFPSDVTPFDFEDNNETEAKGKLLIYLLENKLM